MKGAIASVELFVHRGQARARRLTLTLTAPERAERGDGWVCRVALADLHRPVTLAAPDSVSALAAALSQARAWVDTLAGEGAAVTRDREGAHPFRW